MENWKLIMAVLVELISYGFVKSEDVYVFDVRQTLEKFNEFQK